MLVGYGMEEARAAAFARFVLPREKFEHSLRVARYVGAHGVMPQRSAVAYLHDVLEDTEVTAEILALFFRPQTVQAVVTLTRVEGETYAEYVERIAATRELLPVEVKKADLAHNLGRTKAGTSLEKRYRKAWAVIVKAERELREE